MIHEAILGSHIDWYCVPQPKGKNNFVYPGKAETWWKPSYPAIRPYMHELLNYLVEVRGQVCSVAQSLLDRTLDALLDGLAEETQTVFGKVKRLGPAVYSRCVSWFHPSPIFDNWDHSRWQAVIELTFVHKSLGYYKDSPAGKALEEKYGKQIESGLYAVVRGDAKILTEARRATRIQFLCSKLAKDKEKESTSGSIADTGNSTRSGTKGNSHNISPQ